MICEKNKCTGCFACYNICPKNAIEMKEDKYGYIYPKINKEKCINCGLCKKVCPSLNKLEKIEPQKCYAMYAKDKNIRNNSTSGGIATQISKKFLKNNGIVYGASFDNECNVVHKRIEKIKELTLLQGSKYVHSYINDAFKQVKKDLLNDKKVLFFGTACQIAGLKKYLVKEYENLYLIDIICHGVPSQKFLKEEVKRINGNTDVERIIFRRNNKYGFAIIKDEQCVYEVNREKSPYIDSFLLGLTLRNNCHNCMYADRKRVSDITIGDFWGLNKTSKFYDIRSGGVSAVICNTTKGINLVENVKNDFEIEEREYDEAVKGNAQLKKPASKYKEAQKFRNDYLKYGFLKAYKKNTRIIRLKRKYWKIRDLVKKLINSDKK